MLVRQSDEHHRPATFGLEGQVDLRHQLVGFVGRVDERPPDVPRLGRKLRQDGVAEGFSSDAGAVGDEEHGAMGHEKISSAELVL